MDNNCKETKIIILTDKMTDEINNLIKKMSEEAPQIIAGFKEDRPEILEQTDIFRIYAEDIKIFAVTSHGEFLIRLRL